MSAAPAVFTEIAVADMHCPSCAATIERHLKQLGGVTACQVNFAAGRVGVGYDPGQIALPQLEAALEGLGHAVRRPDAPAGRRIRATPRRLRLAATTLAGVMAAAGYAAQASGAP